MSPSGFRLVVPGTAEGVRLVLSRLETFVAEHPELQPVYADFGVALDEVVSNVAKYAYANAPGDAVVSVAFEADVLSAEVLDDGPRFNPLERAAPRTDQGIADRPIGGLGIHIVNELMDGVAWDDAEGRNRLRFHKRVPR